MGKKIPLNTNIENSPNLSSESSPGTVLPWVICGLAAVFYCYEYLLRISPNPMIPELMQAFGVTAAGVGAISGFYFYAYTPMQLPVGVMLDRYGPRRVLTFAVFACAFGTLIFAQATDYWMAALGRFLIGFGSAFAFVGVLKLATAWLPPHRFALVAGLTTTLGMLGALFGQNALVVMVEQSGWANTLWLFGIFGFGLLPIMWFIVRDRPKGQANPSTDKNGDHLSYKKLFKDIYRILKNPQIWVNGLVGALIILPTTVFAELWGGEYLKVVYGFSAKKAAFAVSLIFLGWVIGGPIAGFISDNARNRKWPLIIGATLALLTFLVFMYVPNLSTGSVYALLLLFGIFSSVEVIVFAVAKENAPSTVTATATATTNFMIVCAGFFQPIIGKFIDLGWDGTLLAGKPVYTPENYKMALMILPISLALTVVFACFLKETHCQSQVD